MVKKRGMGVGDGKRGREIIKWPEEEEIKLQKCGNLASLNECNLNKV